MSEPKKVDHWAFLATELGAAVPEPEEDIASEISPFGEEIPVAEQPQPEYVPPEEPEGQVEEVIVVEQVVEEPAASEPPPVRRERSRSSWDLLANELGIDVPPEPEPEIEPEPIFSTPVAASEPIEPTEEPPAVDRAVAERMFESLFSAQEPEAGIPEKAFPPRDSRPAPKREESRYAPKREESRHGGKREEPRRGGRTEEEPRRGGRTEEEPRRGGRSEESRRGGRAEESRYAPKSEPVELFLDEDEEADELETTYSPAAEEASPEEKKKRRHRRRGGRKDREKEPEKRPAEKPILNEQRNLPEEEDDDDVDEFSFFDEPLDLEPAPRSAVKPQAVEDDDEETEEERSGKRRRSRRGSRKPKKPVEAAEEKLPPSKAIDKFADDKDDDLWEDEDDEEIDARSAGASRRGGPAKSPHGREDQEIRPAFRSIPTWDETIGLMVAKNMESRNKGPNRGRSQNQNRGGRRDNRR